MDTFTCSMCGKTYNKGRSDDEAEAEMQQKWGEQFVAENCDVVCDDCYKEMFE